MQSIFYPISFRNAEGNSKIAIAAGAAYYVYHNSEHNVWEAVISNADTRLSVSRKTEEEAMAYCNFYHQQKLLSCMTKEAVEALQKLDKNIKSLKF